MFDLEDILGSVVKSAAKRSVRATAKKSLDAYHSRLKIDREAIIKAAEQMPQRNVGIFGGTYGLGEIERKADKSDGNNN